MAYVPPDRSAPGTMVEVAIRASRVPAEVVSLPVLYAAVVTARSTGRTRASGPRPALAPSAFRGGAT